MTSDEQVDPKTHFPRAIASQGREYFRFPGYRCLGIAIWLALTYAPLYVARTFSNELNSMFAYSDVLSELVIVSTLACIVYTSTFCVMGIIYSMKHPFFEKFKSNTQSWPWELDPEGWPAERTRQMTRTYFNILVLNGGIGSLIGYFGLNEFNTNFDDLPSYPTMMSHLVLCFLLGDLVFYCGHRLMHHPKCYWMHKKHHEADNPTVTNAMSVSPFEFIFVDYLVGFPGVMVLGAQLHYVTIVSLFLWLWYSNLDDHFGYEFPWMWTKIFPWSTTNTFHNFHHMTNEGNFAAHTMLWDSIFGTNAKFIDTFENQASLRKDNTGTTQIKFKTD